MERDAQPDGGRRAAFLASAEEELTACLDDRLALRAVAAIAVPEIADWCVVDLLGDDGSIERVAVAHTDPAKEIFGWELARRFPLRLDAPIGIPYVLRSGQSDFAPDIPEWAIAAVASNAEHLRLLHELGLGSGIVVPLRARGGVLGALSLVTAESGRRYDEDDLALAESLAERCVAAVDRARLVRRALVAEGADPDADALLDANFGEAPVVLAVCDRELRYTRVTSGLAAVNRLPVDAHVGRSIADVRPELGRLLARAARQALENGETSVSEITDSERVEQDDGTRWTVTCYPVQSEDMATGVVLALTEVDRPGKEATQGAGEERAGGDEQFRALVEAAPNAIISADAQGVVVLVNRKAVEMFGYERHELIGQRVELLVPNRFRADHVEHRAGFSHDATVRAMGEGRDLRARRKDGTEFPVEISLGPADTAMGLRVTAVIADITERKRAEAELERRAARQAAIATLGERALEGAELEELMDRTVRIVAEHLGTELASVLEAVPGQSELTLRAAVGFADLPSGSASFPTRGTVSDLEVHTEAPVIVSDLDSDVRFTPGVLAEQGVVAGMSALIGPPDEPLGVLGAHERGPRNFTPDELTFLQAVANILGDAVRRFRSEAQIRHQALHDPLTGLGNRALLCERLTHWCNTAQRRLGSRAAVLFLDLNNFKLINDSLGHPAGDCLLIALAERLAENMRAGDTVARFGGDEFTMLCEHVKDDHEAAIVAERILTALQHPFDVEGHGVVVSASIGIAFATDATTSPDEPLRSADAAMYRAKEQGGGYAFFDPALHSRAIKRLDLELALRDAVRDDDFFLVYQPLVRIATGALVGFEALIRWNHHRYGQLGPAEFIPIAEATGLIVPISLFALQEASRQMVRWNALCSVEAPLRVAVNLSAMELTSELPRRVEAALTDVGADPAGLCLEITETMLMHDAPTTADTLAALKALGVRLAIDDFGTGYSSLAYLRRFPVDELKIDRSFVGGIGRHDDETAIVSAIISMAHALDLETVAEGVETQEQLAELRRLGADFGQGYHFARPMDADKIDRLLELPTQMP